MRENELTAALSSMNQKSALDWAAQFPTSSVVELARKLPGGIAPIELQRELLLEARERGVVPQLVRAFLVRLLNSEFPRGLSGATDAQSGLQSVFSMWLWSFDPDQRTAAEAIWTKVVAALEAHPDWVPQRADEPRLMALFSGHDLERSKKATLVASARARIEANFVGRKTNREKLASLESLPAGYGYMYATQLVDNAVRNGGFSQLFGASGGIEIPLAILGMRALKQEELAVLLEESLAYARSYHREKLGPGLFTAPSLPAIAEPRPWAQLDKAYEARLTDLFEGFAKLMDVSPALFEPPFRVLRNAEDGRTWKVRTSGVLVEIQIVLDDGTAINRERRCASAEKAELEALALVAEQLQDGFVEAR